MKKKFTLMLVCTLAVLQGVAQTLWKTSFNTEEEFKQWTVIDSNNDEKTWQFSADGTPSKVFYSYSSSNQADDWLISPDITPTEDGPLMVKYTYKGSYYGEAMEVYMGHGKTPEQVNILMNAYQDIKDKEQGGYFLIEGKAGETFNLAFHCTTPADKWRLYLISVEVSKGSDPVDLKLQAISARVSGNNRGSEKVSVKVSNVGLADVNGFSLGYIADGGTPVIETVNQTLKQDEEMTYTFNTPVDLSIPRHQYTLQVFTSHDDDIDHTNDTLATQVRHKAPATVPYACGFEPEDYTEEFKSFNLNDDSGKFEIYYSTGWFSMARTGMGCLAYNYDKENAGDDWVILEPIKVEAGYHALKFWYSGSDNHPEKFAVYYGSEQTPQAMTNKIVEYAPFLSDPYVESINILYFDQPQTIYIGFHAFSDKDENWLTIDDLTFDKVSSEDVDMMITNLSNPTNVVRSNSDRTVKFELRNVSIVDTKGTVKLMVDEKELISQEVDVKAQEYKTVTIDGILSAVEPGNHTLTIAVTCDKDKNTANDTLRTEITVLGTPVKYWDFEDKVLPTEFSYLVKDTAVIHPDAGEEFNANGWGFFNIGKHEVLGETVLACNTWFTTETKAYRWLVMPVMKVTGDDAFFAWNANSFNANYLESYEVQVSTDPDFYWLNTDELMDVERETIFTKARGVSLAKYKDKNIYVAICVKTLNGEALILDNIGFYGGITNGTPDGISTISTGSGINTSAAVYNLTGKQITTLQGDKLSAKSLPAGIYMIKRGAEVKKVMIK